MRPAAAQSCVRRCGRVSPLPSLLKLGKLARSGAPVVQHGRGADPCFAPVQFRPQYSTYTCYKDVDQDSEGSGAQPTPSGQYRHATYVIRDPFQEQQIAKARSKSGQVRGGRQRVPGRPRFASLTRVERQCWGGRHAPAHNSVLLHDHVFMLCDNSIKGVRSPTVLALCMRTCTCTRLT